MVGASGIPPKQGAFRRSALNGVLVRHCPTFLSAPANPGAQPRGEGSSFRSQITGSREARPALKVHRGMGSPGYARCAFRGLDRHWPVSPTRRE